MTVIALPHDLWGWQLRRAGQAWRATGPGFAEGNGSPAGFGSTPERAVAALAELRRHVPGLEMFAVCPPVVWASLDGELILEKP